MNRILLIFFVFSSFQSVYSQGYYPLQTGNFWHYSDAYVPTTTFTTLVMLDTIMPNSLTYFHLKSNYELGDQYFRQSSTKVYNYSNSSQTEELWYDFSKTVGDTVATHYYPHFDTSDVVVTYDDTVNIYGA